MNIDFTEIGLDNNRVRLTLLAYDEPHRFYHNRQHVDKMLNLLNKDLETLCHRTFLSTAAAIIYHDAVYTWGNLTNEVESAKLFTNHSRNISLSNVTLIEEMRYPHQIEAAIKDTALELIGYPAIGFQGDTKISDKLREYDLWDLHHSNKRTTWNNTYNLWRESAWDEPLDAGSDKRQASFRKFLKERVQFLAAYAERLPEKEAAQVTQHIEFVIELGDLDPAIPPDWTLRELTEILQTIH